eukprot:8165230-Lingulodinium_polyedra.AAC.1
MPLTHDFWADNLVFFVSTIEQAEVMAVGAIAALGVAGLQWKPSSLELLWSDAVPVAERQKQLVVQQQPVGSSAECIQHTWAARERLRLLGT